MNWNQTIRTVPELLLPSLKHMFQSNNKKKKVLKVMFFSPLAKC